jgi:methylated-DNA-[protein]-cysteine S-methyltransferase
VELWIDTIGTPIGTMTLIVNPVSGGACALDFSTNCRLMQQRLALRFGPVSLVARPDPGGISSQVRAYFAGDAMALEAVPVDTAGTPFQAQVWAALRHVPPGRTTSYGHLAADIGRPGAARAVGLANGQNPVAVVLPCHRVVGADGSLTGYGGGLKRKRWLLEHEARCFAASFSLAAG